MKMRKIFMLIICAALLISIFPHMTAEATETDSRYDPVTDGIASSYYAVDRDAAVIYGIAPGTTAAQLQKVCMPEGIVFSAETVATGTILAVEDPDAEDSVHALTAVVTGDLNGDGGVTITDMLMVKSKLLGQELSHISQIAGDVNYDGGVTITDFLRLKAYLLGLEGIQAGRKAEDAAQEALLLLTPGASTLWTPDVEAAAFASYNDLVTVSADGTITAGAAEGSTYIYALDAEGNVLESAIVTILQEQLRVSFNQDKYGVLLGQTLQLNPQFNHPVNPAVTWESADPAIASVDANGVLTGHIPGVTQITASIQGSSTSVELTVMPPITGLDTEKKLYKVKPGNSCRIGLEIAPSDVGEEFIWTSSNADVVTVTQDGTVTGVTYGTATVTVTGKYSGLTASCEVKVCDVKQVAMTFDDGPSIRTAKLLDFCKENDIKVTFFLVGDRMQSYSATLKREVAEGHEIGYHSWAHKNQTDLSSAQIKSDYEMSAQILYDLTGAEFTLWRTPGGAYDNRVTECVPLPHILWSLDTRDWQTRDTNKIYQAIVRNAKDGSIVLLHDLYTCSVDGAIMAMEEMLKGDYEFVTVTELLSRDGTPPEDGETYVRG